MSEIYETILSSPNVALKNQIGSKVMKIWLPDSLYRVKPLLLMLAGAVLLLVTNSVILTILGSACLGYGTWIIIARMMWSNAGMLKTRVGSRMAGEHKTHVIDM